MKKLSDERAARTRLLSRRYTDKVVIKPVSKKAMRYILKRDAMIFAALAKCDTSG